VPLDKEKGVVKDEDTLSGAKHRFFGHPMKGLGPRTWDITAASFFLVDRSTEPSIRPKLRS
jgi:hypothetical protein